MFAVIFEVEPSEERRGEYLELASFLKPALEKIEGFLDVERFASRRDKARVLSLSLWRDEKAVIRWRTLGAHHEVQTKGRSGIFREYHLRVGEITADTALASSPVQQRFDETETGAAKVVTISEVGAGSLNLPATGTEGLIGQEEYDSIYNPGKTIVLASWRDRAAADAWKPEPMTRHRHVRIIRDYGMYDRREAPQYYPNVTAPAHG